MNIQTRQDSKRGCGWRKEGAMYLVAPSLSRSCGKLPISLHVCPTCGNGIRPSRAWTWIDADVLTKDIECKAPNNDTARYCIACPLDKELGRVGLVWVGGAYYSTTDSFVNEVRRQGVCRRITTVPKGFEIGKTYVFLAHRKAIEQDDKFSAGVFCVFQPKAIEYVVKEDDSEEKLERLEKRGITLVKIERVGETKKLFEKEKKDGRI